MADPSSLRRLGFSAALATVIANVVGTGVFTTLGYQVTDTTDGFALLMLWAVGGIIALTGALSYGELSAAIRGSGGEYRFLGRIYHPGLGTIAGWVSIAVGFAAPVALAAMALGRYAGPLVGVQDRYLGILVICGVTGVHLLAPETGGRVQVAVTSLKVLLIVAFVAAGLSSGIETPLTFAPGADSLRQIASGPFAIALVFVSYAYSGFNAAAYFQGEVVDAERNVPRALVLGTLLVTALYVALNWVFLRTTPIADLTGQIEVGAIAAGRIFGPAGGRVMSAIISLLLISTISAMTLAGPRVIEAMAEDLPPLRPLAERTGTGAPARAVLLQGALALAFVLTNSFDGVLTYAGFTLTLFSLLAVGGVMLLRHREPDLPRPYRTWGYPWTPLFFVAFSLWTVVVVMRDRPTQAVGGAVTLGLAALLTWVVGEGDGAPPG
ncbi:MAG: APC family permease [Gemmatimonadetes bacterium]|mgnify:CR=1 FL=1|nr:APC family permease [Gemmatimonadota bacterium]MCB9505161.1 APC family permease [Gemmatimonadales bacterium]MCA9762164.1 APC family permease [Gemmatimonadota bacterium]MCA9769203.1 APC family permease [Gemmatimonadota bacterium]MCB9518665.1 APC family permease [Gemmatimonadales bacterium]